MPPPRAFLVEAGAGGAYSGATMDLPTAGQAATALTAIGGLVAAAYGWFAWALPRIKDVWANRPMAVVRAGIETLTIDTREMRRLGEIEARKGSDRGQALDVLTREFRQFRGKVDALVAADPLIATFDAAPDGTLTSASETLQTWTGRNLEQLQRWGFVTAIATSDRLRIRGEVDSLARDVRRTVLQFALVDAGGKEFQVIARWTPIPEGEAQCEKFVVVLQRQP
jgi:hypothetical protein